MTADSNKILAGVGPAALAYFAAADTAGPVAVSYTAEVQTLTFTGTGTAGTWTCTLPGYGNTAVGLAYNISTAALATALSAAFSITVGVAGTAGTSYVLTFPASRGNLPMVVVTNSITGVTAITPVETTAGAGAVIATAAIPAAFQDAGWCTQAGLVANVNESSTDVKAYGTLATLRVIISESSRSFDLEFLEHNLVSLAIYNRLQVGTIAYNAQGAFQIAQGTPTVQTYAAIFDVVDGLNHLRVYCPRLQVSAIKARTVAAGKEIPLGVTLTALPDASGNAVYENYALNALAS